MDKASAEDLLSLKDALERRTSQFLPMQTQLPAANRQTEGVESGFLI